VFLIKISDAHGCPDALHAFKAVNVSQARSRERYLLMQLEDEAVETAY
jgi:hypothetical protein